MKAVLVELKPYNAATSERVTLRICSANDPLVTLVDGGPGEFLPVLASGPTISRSVFDGAFTSAGTAGNSSITVALDEGSIHEWMAYVWADAEVTVWTGEAGAPFSSYVQQWKVAADSIQRGAGVVATIGLSRPARLNRPLLYLSFAGTDDGDAGDVGEGRAAVRGALKPWLAGTARYVPPVLIDAARQIYCYHGYGPTGGATEAFEGGVSKGAPDFTWASYLAMRDAVLTSDQWGHCPSLGLIRLGGQPSFPITIHASGDKPAGTVLTTTADVIKRLLEGPGGIAAPAIPASNITTLNTLRPEPIDFYLAEQVSVESLMSQLMVGANGYWLENEAGAIILGLIPPGLAAGAPAPTRTLDIDGNAAPIVKGSSEEAAGVPIYRLRLGGQRTHGPHSPSDVAASITAVVDVASAASFTFPPTSSPPVSPVPTVGDLWPDTSGGVTVMRRYDGATWVRVTDIGSNVVLGPLGSMSAIDIIGNSFKRTAAGNDWDYAVVSNQVLAGSAYARMGSVATGFTMVALDDDNASTARASMKYYFQTDHGGGWAVYSNGAVLGSGTTSTPPVGTNIEIRYGGTKVEFLIGQTVVYTVANVAAGQSLFAKFWAYQPGSYSQVAAGYASSNVDPNATRNEVAGNLIPSPIALDRVELGGGAYIHDGSGGGNGRQLFYGKRAVLGALNSNVYWESGYTTMGCTPGETLFVGCAIGHDGSGPTTDYVSQVIQWFGSGSYLGADEIVASRVTGDQVTAAGGVAYSRGAIVVPINASSCRVFLIRVAGAQGGYFIAAEAYLGRAQQGADITSFIDGPPQALDFLHTHDGTAEAGQFPRNLQFKLMSAAGQITAGVSWSYRLISGGVNGGGVTGSYQALSSSTFPVTNMNGASGTFNSATIEIAATLNGIMRTKTFTINKLFGAVPVAPSGGGGSGGTLKSKTGGWSPINSTSFAVISGTDLNGCVIPTGMTTTTLSATLNFDPDVGATNGAWTIETKWQRNISGTWTDIGGTEVAYSEVTGWGGSEPEPVASPGAVTVNTTDSLLSAGASYDYRLVARLVSGTRSHSILATASVVAP